MTLVYSTDLYGIKLAKSDGSQARNFLKFCLPRELPEMQGTKIVNIYQMDEGLNHPGYRVFDTRKIDISQFDFEVVLGQVSITDLDWEKWDDRLVTHTICALQSLRELKLACSDSSGERNVSPSRGSLPGPGLWPSVPERRAQGERGLCEAMGKP